MPVPSRYLALALCAAMSNGVSATNFEVTVAPDGFSFSPNLISNAKVNDTVTFTKAAGSFSHNVSTIAGSSQSFRCATDCGANGGPTSAAWSATITLTTVGTINYQCDLHNFMTGSIVVATPVSLQSFEVD